MKIKFSTDLLIILLWTISTIFFITIPVLNGTIIRTILGLVIVLFLPGYVLVATLFPKRDDLDVVERIALSFGLSIAIVPLIGLLLNYTFGIRLIPILVSICIYIIGLVFAAEYRRKEAGEERFEVSFKKLFENIIAGSNFENRSKIEIILTGILIFTIILSISMLYIVITMPKVGERFTEFYILNSTSGRADNYTKELKVGLPEKILVGVGNHEYKITNYTVQIVLDNGKDILVSKELMTNHNQTWEENMTFVADKVGKDLKLQFLLFKENNFTDPYRELHLWVNSS